MTLKKYYATSSNYTLISFSFRAWIGLIWEISWHSSVGFAWNFGARLFWNDTTLSKSEDIRYIKVFLNAGSEKCSCPSMYIMHMYMYMYYVHTWTRIFFRASIQKKLNITYILEFWQSGVIPKKTRAEISRKTHRRMPRDLSYETDSDPKTKTDQFVILGA